MSSAENHGKQHKKGSLLKPEDPLLWKIEKQVDAANQHLRLALSLIRKETSRINKAAKEGKHEF
ncbi:MAG: hypothetical protein QW146_03740 [Candidatus Bathyarchaeia archaeon]